MRSYPKIMTLYNRDKRTHRVNVAQIRCPEFEIVNRWFATEKLDGTSLRAAWDGQSVTLGGRTDSAQLYAPLVKVLQETFTPEKFRAIFDKPGEVILFMEGYGNKVQKGGGLYRQDVSVRLFDALVGNWWLEPDNLKGLAESFGVKTVPYLEVIDYLPRSLTELAAIIEQSIVAQEDGGQGCQAEGIVARSHPLLLNRAGERVMWKLKRKDFE